MCINIYPLTLHTALFAYHDSPGQILTAALSNPVQFVGLITPAALGSSNQGAIQAEKEPMHPYCVFIPVFLFLH